MSKRENEQQIQGWFYRADKPDNPDRQVVEYYNYLREKGWTPKQIIGESILSLRELRGDEIANENTPINRTDQQLQEIHALLERLAQTIETAGIRLDENTQDAVNQVRRDAVEHSTIEKSLGGRYQSYKFTDDDEE